MYIPIHEITILSETQPNPVAAFKNEVINSQTVLSHLRVDRICSLEFKPKPKEVKINIMKPRNKLKTAVITIQPVQIFQICRQTVYS